MRSELGGKSEGVGLLAEARVRDGGACSVSPRRTPPQHVQADAYMWPLGLSKDRLTLDLRLRHGTHALCMQRRLEALSPAGCC